MKRLLLILTSVFPLLGFAQIATWDFTGESSGPVTSTAEVYNANLDAAPVLTRGSGAPASTAANSFRTAPSSGVGGFRNDGIAVTNTDYFQNTFSAAPGYVLSLASIDAYFAGTNTFSASPGVTMQYAYSLDGTNFTLIGSPFVQVGNGAMPQISLSGIAALQDVPDNITVTIRFYASGQTTTGGWGYNSNTAGAIGLAFGGSVNLAGGTPCSNTTATIDTASCAVSYTVPSGDEVYTIGGTYMDTIPNAGGCDSILTINLSFVTSINYYPDTDGDGLGDNSATAVAACTPPANHVTNNNDCDDTNPAIGLAPMYYTDADGDGYGSASATGVPSCTLITGSVTNNTDCNDNNAAIHPGAVEIPNNGIDEDCNGSDLVVAPTAFGMYEFQGNDCAAPLVDVTAQPANATFGPYGVGGSLTCASAANVINYSGFNTSAAIDLTQYYKFSVTPANCYGLDLNMIKFNHRLSGTAGTPTLHVRSSLDNYATDLFTKQLAVNGTTYLLDTVQLTSAFDNVTSMVEFRFYLTNMGQTGSTYRHDNVTIYGTANALPTQTYYADTDGDGFGDPAATQTACTAPVGYVSDNTDCNDDDAEEFPGAVWYADADGDGLGAGTAVISCTRPANHVSNDDDCDDTNDQLGLIRTYYVDLDEDGYGDADATGVPSCAPIAGSATNNEDCDDTDEDINPAAAEVCDGVDNNCDGTIDEGFTMVTYYEDADGDTYGDPASSVTDCTQPAGYVTNDDDCDDTNAAIHPGAVDITGNGVDENCDGVDGVLGIEESILAQLNVYPNPGTSSVVLDLASGWNGMEVAFIGVDGKEIALTATQKSMTGLEFNTTALVQGTYFIRLTSDSGTALVRWVKN